MERSLQQENFINKCGMIVLGILCAGYVVFSEQFAEMYISFSFLDFPVFVGEVFLAFCLTLFLVKYRRCLILRNKWQRLLAAYFGFVLAKALWGYWHWGPLALRHAALFYYPIFGVFADSFYYRQYFTLPRKVILSFLLVGFLWQRNQFYYFYMPLLLTLVLLSCILIGSVRNKILALILWVLLIAVMPVDGLVHGARMTIVSNIGSVVFLMIAFWWGWKIKRRIKLAVTILFVVAVAVFFAVKGNQRTLLSIVDLSAMREQFRYFEIIRMHKMKKYRPQEPQQIKLFNPAYQAQANYAAKAQFMGSKKEPAEPISDEIFSESETRFEMVAPGVYLKEPSTRSSATTNIIFRIFIWRDMFHELWAKKPFLFGFDFGKPFRSISLEVLQWGEGEWSRDGWVAMHNSYLDMIYYAGLVGLLFSLNVIFMWLKMVKDFIAARSVSGILLCAIILNWLIAANFLVTLEVPYTAIPIWVLYGLTVAYYKDTLPKAERP